MPKKDSNVAVPDHWLETNLSQGGLLLDANWWGVFHDAALDSLEKQALAANPDIAGALAKVNEVETYVTLAKAERSISLGVGAAASHDRTSENDKLPPFFPIETDRVRAAFNTSYEVDAWGRVKSMVAAAKGEVNAAEADLATIRLSITSEVARIYFELYALQSEAELLSRLEKLKEDRHELQQARWKAGLITEIDVVRARVEMANTKTDHESVQRQIALLSHALAMLVGQAPVDFSFAANAVEKNLPELPVLLPANVLKRRPDIAAADARVDVALARMGVARTAFFPQIRLTGSFGLESADLADFMKWSSRIWSIGPSISLPLLDGGRNRANYAATLARYQQSVANYRKAVLSAFGEVENALSDLQWLSRQISSLNDALAATKDTADILQARSSGGLANSLDAIEAAQAVLELDRIRARLRGQQFVATIAFAKAVGGGWSAAELKNFSENQSKEAGQALLAVNGTAHSLVSKEVIDDQHAIHTVEK